MKTTPELNRIQLKKLLQNWNQNQVEELKTLYTEQHLNPEFMTSIVELFIEERTLEISASWLIKQHYDNKGILNSDQLEQVMGRLSQLNHWESELHLLQIIPKLELSPRLVEILEPELGSRLQSKYTFVRASAFAAYAEIVAYIPELKTEFKAKCLLAAEHEKPSVMVKINRIISKM
jgi:hypothetical protein